MRVPGGAALIALLYISSLGVPAVAVAQLSDQSVAESVLGPQWRQMARRAGMIFAGTVLAAPSAAAEGQTNSARRPVAGAIPAVELRLRVDRAIAGVEEGQILTIHEWAGAWSMHRPMRPGERFLLFLYAPSHLGLTSPVGGWRGQFALDGSGRYVIGGAPATALIHASARLPVAVGATRNIEVVQLERAIGSARRE